MKHTRIVLDVCFDSNNQGKGATIKAVFDNNEPFVVSAAISHAGITANQLESTIVDRHIKFSGIAEVFDEASKRGIF